LSVYPPGNNPTVEELEELIEDADRDGSGSVDFQVHRPDHAAVVDEFGHLFFFRRNFHLLRTNFLWKFLASL
jgi:hypothetical protein